MLVGGTWANQADDFAAVSPLLADNGYCVYTDNLGSAPGAILAQTGDIPTSASELSTVVDKVLAATGRRRGRPRRPLPRRRRAAALVPGVRRRRRRRSHSCVGLAPSNHGTTIDGLQTLGTDLGILGVVNGGLNATGSESAVQQEVGSTVNTTLDATGDTVPGVTYTNIVSRNDEVVTPYTNQYLTAGPGATVHNILLQNVCALDQGDHLSVVYDHIALRLMLNALDPSTAVAPTCTPVAPLVGG